MHWTLKGSRLTRLPDSHLLKNLQARLSDAMQSQPMNTRHENGGICQHTRTKLFEFTSLIIEA
jgi:hypothetical protein